MSMTQQQPDDDDKKSPFCHRTVTVKGRKDESEWQEYDTVILDCDASNDDDNTIPPPDPPRSRFGGRTDAPLEPATGFFYVKQVSADDDNRYWTMVDPEGHRFHSLGLNSVSHNGGDKLFRQAFEERFGGDPAAWARETHGLLVNELQCNTLGNWSAAELFQQNDGDNGDQDDTPINIPYCPRWGFMSTYKNCRPDGSRYDIYKHPMPVFDPAFEPYCQKLAQDQLDKTKDDPWLLGHFSDNELPFHERNVLQRYLELPENDPGHEAAKQFMKEHNIESADQITKQHNEAMGLRVVQEYYRIVGTAIKAADPNHLYLGSRFHGLVTNQTCTFAGSAPYLDVISVNYYRRWTPEQERIDKWCTALQDYPRPIIMTEWYAKGQDSESTNGNINNGGGGGFYVPTQKDRAAFYQHFCLGLLQNRNVVGWHWFRYSDYASNCGVVNVKYEPYDDFSKGVKQLNERAYGLKDYYATRQQA